MKQVFNGRFGYQGLWGYRSICYLEIFREETDFTSIVPARDKRSLVIVTELNDNPGTSITNAIPQLAQDVAGFFNLNIYNMIWVEQYEYNPNEFAEVELIDREAPEGALVFKKHPEWKRITVDRIREVIGNEAELEGEKVRGGTPAFSERPEWMYIPSP